MGDKFAGADRVDWAAYRAEAVVLTLDDFTLTNMSKGLYVGATGNVSVLMGDDASSVVFVGVPAGTILPIRVLKVFKTGTTASSIVALA